MSNILQVWLGDTLPKERRECMDSVINNMRAGDTYQVVANNANLFEWCTCVLYSSIREKLLDESPHPDFWNVFCKNNSLTADFIRVETAMQDPNLLYIDNDVMISRFDYIESNDFVYLGEDRGLAEFFMFYVNGQCAYFSDLLDHVVKYHGPVSYAFVEAFDNIQRLKKVLQKFKHNVFNRDSYKRNWFEEK